MSAFVHADKRFCAIVSFRMGSKYGYTHYTKDHKKIDLRDRAVAATVAQMLKDQNIKSVMIRYPQDTLDTLPGPNDLRQEIKFEIVRGYSPLEIIKACQSYNYQACEDPDYNQSEASDFVKQTMSAAIHALPEYEDARGWEIN